MQNNKTSHNAQSKITQSIKLQQICNLSFFFSAWSKSVFLSFASFCFELIVVKSFLINYIYIKKKKKKENFTNLTESGKNNSIILSLISIAAK